jgi:ubiquinone/menaquinone biosynthesis C-methylase UbiE
MPRTSRIVIAQRAEAGCGLGVRFVDADAEALPFADQSFGAVVSAFGAMFAADQERAASEMIRVCRRGRRVGLANWTPDGFIGSCSSPWPDTRRWPIRRLAVCLGYRRAARGVVWRVRLGRRGQRAT